jgi:hypothetical protein
MPYFIHGILIMDLRHQAALQIEHPLSFNVRYSFLDIASAFQAAVRKRRAKRPVGLKGKYYFASIRDQPSLDGFRELIWSSAKRWDGQKKRIVGLDWPALQQGNAHQRITSPCPICHAPGAQQVGFVGSPGLISSLAAIHSTSPTGTVIRICSRHGWVVRVPVDADPYRRRQSENP